MKIRLAALLLAALVVVAGCGGVRTRTVADKRPPIRNGAGAAVIRASFTGKPYRHGPTVDATGTTYKCRLYVQSTAKANASVGAWAVQVCYREPPAS